MSTCLQRQQENCPILNVQLENENVEETRKKCLLNEEMEFKRRSEIIDYFLSSYTVAN